MIIFIISFMFGRHSPLLNAFTLHEPELRNYLQRRLGCQQQVADILQDMAEKLLRRPVRDIRNPRSYLFQTASNAVMDHHRAERCRQVYLREQWTTGFDHPSERSPEETAIATEMISVVESAIAELPPLTRKIFHLYRLDGLSQQAIADQLGISRSTVERRLSAAITHWQKRLQQKGL